MLSWKVVFVIISISLAASSFGSIMEFGEDEELDDYDPEQEIPLDV